MSVITERIHIKTKGEGDILDLTADVEKAVKNSGLRRGIVTVFCSRLHRGTHHNRI